MRRVRVVALLALTTWTTAPTRGETQEGPGALLAEESAGVVEVDGESRLVISGFSGKLTVRAGRAGELRFMSADLAAAQKKLPLRLWLDEGTFHLRPIDPASGAGRIVEAVVPEQLRVEIRANDSRVAVSGLRSGVGIVGARLEADVRGITGGVSLELETSRLQADTLEGDVALRGKAIEGRLARAPGSIALGVEASKLELIGIGTLDGDLGETTAVVNGATGPVRLRCSGGRADLTALVQGGEFRLSKTPIVLQKSKGDFEIESDAEVRFSDNEAALHVNGFGATVRGSGNQGLVEVRMDGGAVSLERIGGPTRVQGQRLEVMIKSVTGELFTDLQDSNLVLDNPAGSVTIVAESGTTKVSNASRDVSIRARRGEIQVTDLRGSIEIDADVEVVEVSWASMFPSKDSSVKNEGGRVEMRFPSNAGLQLSAETKFGRIENSLPGLSVDDAATSAKGAIGLGNAKTSVRIQAGGDIVLATRSP